MHDYFHIRDNPFDLINSHSQFRCDLPRTPHRRTQEMPACSGGSRTAPRPMNSLNSSIVGIGKAIQMQNACHALLIFPLNQQPEAR